MRLLVTGAAGFIGSNFVRLALEKDSAAEICVLDALTYAGHISTIQDLIESGRIQFVEGRIQDHTTVDRVVREHRTTHIVNFAAETHNDRSLLESGGFIASNVLGVQVLLEATKKHGLERFVHVSTDEVYGSISEGEFSESSPLEPNTPYSASKAGGDLMVRAYVKAFRSPSVVTRGGNTYGPYQFPEKLIPFFITRLIDSKKVPVYGEGNQVREWMHASDHAAGVWTALLRGTDGEVYNVGDDNERRNREVVAILLDELGRDDSFVRFIPDPRKGAHDQRYSMTTSKLRSLGWSPSVPFEAGLRETIRWYRDNESWWRPIVDRPDYQEFIRAFYGPSLGEDL
ncbi:MAG: dTDP-glucose 4,6-dehydratase [Fimbriimonadaceae bacterium]|nr:dTDP-glucose 4,6-dehydratase [Fimbriimonadaceae bacterium]